MAKLFRLNFERYHRERHRPAGAGAFFDFVADAARFCAPKPETPLRQFGHKPAPESAQADPNEERWDAEGGNTQTRADRP